MIDTLSNVKTYLDIDGSGYDSILTSFCESADASIKAYLHRDLEEAEYTEYYDGTGTSVLIFRKMPVTSTDNITSISYWDGDSYEALDSNDYSRMLILPEQHGVYLEGYTFIKGKLNYKVVYTAGYTSDTMPEDIKRAFRELVLLMYDNSPLKNRTVGKLNKVEGGSGGTLTINIDKQEEQRILDRIFSSKRINA